MGEVEVPSYASRSTCQASTKYPHQIPQSIITKICIEINTLGRKFRASAERVLNPDLKASYLLLKIYQVVP